MTSSTVYLRHVGVICIQVPLGLGLEEVVSAREPELRLIHLDNIHIGVSVVRPHPEVHQDAGVEPLPDPGHGHLQAVWRAPLGVGEGDGPTSQVSQASSQGGVVYLDYLGHVDTGLVEVLGLLRDGAVVRTGRSFQQTFQDDLQLVGQHLEGRHAGPVLGDDVTFVPGSTGELEEVLARVDSPVHRTEQGGGGLDTF